MLSAKLRVNKSVKPSLAAERGHELNWSKYDTEVAEFDAWITEPFNAERDGPAHLWDGNLPKIHFAIENVLTHLAVHKEWGWKPSFEWLLDGGCFDDVYTSYAEYLNTERGNDLSYIAKQLGDLQHPIEWASKREWEWGVMPPAGMQRLLEKLGSLRGDYTAQASKSPLKRTRELRESDQSQCALMGFRKFVQEWQVELLGRFDDTDTSDMTDDDKLEVCDCLMCLMAARGGRAVDLYRVYLGFTKQNADEWLPDIAEHGGVIVGSIGQQWELLVKSKAHFVHSVLHDAGQLLDLYSKCFPELSAGAMLFSPAMHGVRSSRSRVQDEFESSTKLSDYFAIVTKQRFGLELTPYTLRRMNSMNLQSIDASPEVRRSHSALLGTGVANLEGTYDRRSEKEKGFVASEVQRLQFNELFVGHAHNVMVPALVAGVGGVSIAIGRLLRQEPCGTQLLALFAPSTEKFFELSTRFIRTDVAKEFPRAQMVIDSATGQQLWRSRVAAIERANTFFSEHGINQHEFAVDSVVCGSPELRPRDMVYLPSHCTVAEVKRVCDGENEQLEVMLATELMDLPGRSSMQTFFRFLHNSEVITIERSKVIFPVDLTFNAAACHLILQKSADLETV